MGRTICKPLHKHSHPLPKQRKQVAGVALQYLLLIPNSRAEQFSEEVSASGDTLYCKFCRHNDDEICAKASCGLKPMWKQGKQKQGDQSPNKWQQIWNGA